ncbi:ATP-binding response regulator [Synoicihabitans lomoniglobus]|uniref:histidine kinase n=1 Tax=Synoicihabitans lomoniglobus TaxID=2909285 RepID=A0AAE9ZW31_9BACT|nr:response regulator [Opitutaceae bacterium LMO-M01]WED63563.1 response regulator [Opitutaceae bacterium LMO-M01]
MTHTILVVEDNRNSIYLMEQMLTEAGHRVQKAGNGQEALDLIKVKGLPDLIVSDALMPTMDGFELCHSIRRDPQRCHVPFVLYTATFTDASDEHFAKEIGADLYLIKPFEPEKLVPRFEQVITEVRAAPPRPPTPPQKQHNFLEGHSRRMSVKLEAKVDELSASNAALASSEAEIRELNNKLVDSIRRLEVEVEERRRVATELQLGLKVAAMGSFGFDFDRGTSWWTAEALALLGFSTHQKHLAWSSLATRIPEEKRASAAAVFSPEPDDPQSREVEFTLVQPDGSHRFLYAHSELVEVDESGESRRIGVIRDISIRRRGELDRLKLERRLRQSQKMEAIGNLAGGIAHDFNNILAVIAATSELLEIDAATSELPQRWRDGIGDIREASRRARDLVNQILMFSRNERAEITALDLRQIIEEAANQVTSTMPAHVVIRPHFKTKRSALANSNQVHRILLNLCTNAKHAIGHHPGEITINLHHVELNKSGAARRPPLTPGHYLKLEVIDTGCGMDEETVQRVFEPFYSTRPAGEGTGLGLAVVHGIMANHNGAIFVDSNVGEGTTFTLFFPAADETPKPSSRTFAGQELPVGKGEHILVVDDEPAVAKVATTLISRLGYHVETMTDSIAARDRLRSEPLEFDLVVTDYFMPNLTGADLARAVWEKHPHLPMIMIVGFGGQMDANRAKAEGFKAFVSKPFTMQTMAEAIAHGLAATPR